MSAVAPSAAATPDGGRLRITEIFHSLQGESELIGWPTVFIRLTGCPLRCSYCDTAYAFHGGQWQTIEDIVERARGYGTRHVCVTGGEPLAQRSCLSLLQKLCDADFVVSLETSGALPLEGVDSRVIKVMDLKTPDSGECERNRWQNLDCLSDRDQIKLVIGSAQDYGWSVQQLNERRLADRCTVLFSPSHGRIEPRELADWILRDRLPVRLQIQLHKLLWGNQPGR